MINGGDGHTIDDDDGDDDGSGDEEEGKEKGEDSDKEQDMMITRTKHWLRLAFYLSVGWIQLTTQMKVFLHGTELNQTLYIHAFMSNLVLKLIRTKNGNLPTKLIYYKIHLDKIILN